MCQQKLPSCHSQLGLSIQPICVSPLSGHGRCHASNQPKETELSKGNRNPLFPSSVKQSQQRATCKLVLFIRSPGTGRPSRFTRMAQQSTRVLVASVAETPAPRPPTQQPCFCISRFRIQSPPLTLLREEGARGSHVPVRATPHRGSQR